MFNKRILKLQGQRKALLAEADALHALTGGDNARALTDDEQARFDAIVADGGEVTTIDKNISDITALAERHRTMPTVDEAADDADAVLDDADIQVGVDRRTLDPTGGFDHFGDFALAVQNLFNPAGNAQDDRVNRILAATGMSSGIGSDGGLLIPPEFSNIIWDMMREDDANLLDACDGYTVEGESLEFNGVDETSRATGSRWGGVRGYWIAEAEQMTKSKPTFRKIKLEPKQLAVMIYVTDKLLNNSPIALQQFLTRAASSEISFMTSDAIIEGDGSGKPLGILNSDALIEVDKESGQDADTIVKANIDNMWSQCHARWRQAATWYINQDCEPQLANLSMAVGTGGAPVYLPPGGISATPFATLMGRPVKPIEFCSTVGTKGDIILANLGAYCAGTKGTVRSAMSIHLRFDYNESVFRFLFDVDGQPWIAKPMTPFKGTKELSPFVALESRDE